MDFCPGYHGFIVHIHHFVHEGVFGYGAIVRFFMGSTSDTTCQKKNKGQYSHYLNHLKFHKKHKTGQTAGSGLTGIYYDILSNTSITSFT
jgi:hypothetical protein